MDASNIKMTPTVKANSNIALIKYWGKWDEARKLPYNSSLSITLDNLYTQTSVGIIDSDVDVFYFNGEKAEPAEIRKISAYLDEVRAKYGKTEHLQIVSNNFVPTAAGFASSACGYAALAKAVTLAYELEIADRELSALARMGSVSAARSVYGDFVTLEQRAEYAQPFADASEYAVIAIVLTGKKKKILSREAMRSTVETSPYYGAWVENTQVEFELMKQAIIRGDFTQVGELAEGNCLKMHATTLGAKPPFTYFNGDTLQAMDVVRTLRAQGTECYFTIDAGPNVKVLCQSGQAEQVKAKLAEYFTEQNLVLCYAGSGYTVLDK